MAATMDGAEPPHAAHESAAAAAELSESELRVAAATQSLNAPDAIMEPHVLDAINTFLSEKGNEAAPEMILALANHYVGYAEKCNLVSGWLRETDGDADADAADAADEDGGAAVAVAEDQLSAMVREHFERDKVDALLTRDTIPRWLTQMMKHRGWRSLLIELYGRHKDSALLKYCIRELSNDGHHREIAAVVPALIADEFTVFDGALVDTIDRISRVRAVERGACARALDFLRGAHAHSRSSAACVNRDRPLRRTRCRTRRTRGLCSGRRRRWTLITRSSTSAVLAARRPTHICTPRRSCGGSSTRPRPLARRP
jgi:hypothetical protein